MIAKLLQRKTATTGGGGGGAFTPSQLTGLQRWYSATDIVTSGSNVTQFNDKSGGSNHATQATGTKQPILKTNQGSGFQTVSFDGFDDIINFASMTLTGDFTIYWIGYMREADGNGGGFFGQAETSDNSLNTFAQGTYWFTGSGDIAQGNNSAITNGLFCEIVARRTGTTVTIEVNGVTNSTSGPVSANPVIGQIGRVYAGYAKVDLAEFLVYNQYHDNATKAQVLSWADGIYKDPYFDKVSLLLHMDGTNGSTTFVDSGPNALAVTATGSASISTSGPKLGTGAGAFTTGARLDVASNAVFAFPGDFTFETWFYLTSINANYNQIGPNVNVSGGFSLYYTGPSGYFGLPANSFVISNRISNLGTVSQALNLNQWYHLALTRSGSTIKLFLDGNAILTATSSYSFAQGALTIGGNTDNTAHSVNGRLDDLRITKGIARTVTVPTAAYPDLYNPYTTLPVSGAALWLDGARQSSLFTDAGATYVSTDGQSVYQWNDLSGNNRHAIQTTSGNRPTWVAPASGRNGLGAINFDGNRWIDLASNASFNFGTADFTVEGWVKPSSYSGNRVMIGNGNNGAIIYFNSAGNILFGYYGTGVNLASASTVSTTSWTHFAICRSGSTLRIFLNGIQSASTTATDNFGGNYATRIGWDPVVGNGNGKYVGQIQNLLIYNGQALYTSNFTPWMS